MMAKQQRGGGGGVGIRFVGSIRVVRGRRKKIYDTYCGGCKTKRRKMSSTKLVSVVNNVGFSTVQR